MKDEFKAMEAYLKELDALKRYDEVKMLSQEVSELKAKLSEVLGDRDKLKKQMLDDKKAKEEVGRLKEALSRTQEELSLFKETKAVLNRGSLTLEQAAEEFVKAKEAEIRARAEAEFKGLRKDFEVKMPRLVYQKLLAILKKPEWPVEIVKVIEEKAEEKAQSKLDDEFQRRVNEEALDKLEDIKLTEWRTFLQAEASRIGSNLKTLVAELQGTWCLTCDRCHRTVTIEVGPREIAALLKGGRVAECPRCTDLNLPPAPLVAPHKINGSALEDLLEAYLAEKGPPGKGTSELSQKESHPSGSSPADEKRSTAL
jgi:hypothetical protein